MTILHLITRSEPGGGQTVVRTLALRQVGAGDRVLVASGPEGGGAAFSGMPGVETLTVPHLVRALRPACEFRALAEIAALYRRVKPDIVHLHTSKAGALGRLAPGIERGRIVYTMHGYDQLRVQNRRLLAADRALRGRCGAVVAVSARDLDLMRADGYDPVLIPNGVEAPQPPDTTGPAMPGAPRTADPLAARVAAIRARGLPVVLTVARDARPKRIDLLKTCARALAGVAEFIWAGGDPAPDDPANLHPLGIVRDAPALLYAADILFLPSDSEGMPLSVLEAMAAGLPVAASAVGGVPELLASGAGLALPNDPAAMAAALSTLALDPEARLAAGRIGRDLWQTRYSAAAMARAYRELYETLL